MDQKTTTWQLYSTSEGAYNALYDALYTAKESIYIEYFILVDDECGERFFNLFLEKAKAGVEVKLILDYIGSSFLAHSPLRLKELRDAGIEIHFFNPIAPWHIHNETLWYFRDHSKLAIIDRRIGFTGGLCIGKAYKDWRESYVRIEGEVVDSMITMFEFMWHKDYKNPDFYFGERKGDYRFRDGFDFGYLMNIPLPRKRFLYYELVKALRKAKKEILITNPYFMPDNKILRHLRAAAKRGVEVKIIIPENPNHRLIATASRSYFDDLLWHGARIFLYKKMIHSKVSIVDDWSTIGSLNFDNVSLRYNFEGNLVSSNPAFAADLKAQFEIDLVNSTEVTLEEWRKRSLFKRFLETLVWTIRKFL